MDLNSRTVARGVVLWLGCLALVLAACKGSGSVCHPTGVLGSCCQASTDCENLKCLTELPDGYCSRSCEGEGEGVATSCPEGSHCVDIEYAGATDPIEGRYCLLACGAGLLDCRDRYQCVLVVGSDQQVCYIE